MNKTHKNAILIIIVSAVLVALLFNIKFLLWFLKLLEYWKFSDLSRGEMIRYYFGWLTFGFHVILFCIIALFNYTWKDKLIPQTISKTGKILLIVVGNIVIFLGAAIVEHIVAYNFDEGLSKRLTILYYLFSNFSISGLALCEAYFIILLRKIKTAELENIRLRQEKSNAELAALKEQVSPHFFFNTLNTLSSVIRTEEKTDSLQFVDNLSQVYRYILESHQNDLVKLKDEIEFLNAYFFLLGKRFEKKLVLDIKLSPNVLKTSIPPMSLQMLVENAIQHNTMTMSKPLKIRIFDENNMICVQNNLQKKTSSESMGIGLSNLLKRYQLITGRDIVINENIQSFIVKLPVIQ